MVQLVNALVLAQVVIQFLLVKSEYQAATTRPVERGALFFQIRQAFPPGEVTAEEANKLGFETAMESVFD